MAVHDDRFEAYARSVPLAITYHHVDVFSDVAYAGNSLAVFVDPPALTNAQMSRITRELRHFETIFVVTTGHGLVHARVFDLEGELDFAGHPILGAACVLHELVTNMAENDARNEDRQWTFVLPTKHVRVRTRRQPAGGVSALLDQGRPVVLRQLSPSDGPDVAAALDLSPADLVTATPIEVISTGLRYLIVPVRGDALVRARIARDDFQDLLAGYGAQFVYVLDAAALEGRHWNNDGLLEDVATGSAAGCVAAYLLRHGFTRDGERIFLAQGRFTGRPSRMAITAFGSPAAVDRVTVEGDVAVVGTGQLHALPEPEPS